MYFRWILQNLPDEAIRNFTIQVVEYLRTFSVNEFKYYFGLDAITVCKHPSGCSRAAHYSPLATIRQQKHRRVQGEWQVLAAP